MSGVQSAPPSTVVVTGLGGWTPAGVGFASLWDALRGGDNGLHPIGSDSAYPEAVVGRISDLKPFRAAFPSVRPPLPIPPSRFAMVAAKTALDDAALDEGTRERFGVMANRNRGPGGVVVKIMTPVFAKGPKKTSPLLFSQSVSNAPLGAVATACGLRGPHLLTMRGGALMNAFDVVARGEAPGMVVVGFEELVPRTFDADVANGMFEAASGDDASWRAVVPTEGAVGLVLEDEAHAKRRGARILARVGGVERGQGAVPGHEAPLHLWGAPDPAILARLAQDALARTSGTLALHLDHALGVPTYAAASEHVEAQIAAPRRGSLKGRLGDGVGMGFVASVAVAAKVLHAREIPGGLLSADADAVPIDVEQAATLVSHLDPHCGQSAASLETHV
ncbi:MAG: beta-ketoacyl synthase N-terminal-like domain-containing protein [Myxococcota bacterium]